MRCEEDQSQWNPSRDAIQYMRITYALIKNLPPAECGLINIGYEAAT